MRKDFFSTLGPTSRRSHPRVAYALSNSEHPPYQGRMQARIFATTRIHGVRVLPSKSASKLDVLRHARQCPVTRQESGARSIRATRKL